MCGLAGMMGPGINQKDLDFIQQLAYVTGLRGQDSTGILQGTIQKKRPNSYYTLYSVDKAATPVNYFLWHHKHSKDGNRELLDNVADNFMAIHCRAATKGKINDENAHPFEIGERDKSGCPDLIGMHNGTLVDAKYQHAEKTDSELFFNDINDRGLDKVLTDLDPFSAYALVMLDMWDGNLVFARNTKRSLYFGVNRVRKVLYWSSEIEMLKFCAARTGVEISKYFNCTENIIHYIRPEDVQIDQAPRWSKVKLVIPERPAVASRIVHQSQSNIVPWTPPNKDKVTRESLHVKCASCDRDMNLLDQYEGANMFQAWMCVECLNTETSPVAAPVDKRMVN